MVCPILCTEELLLSDPGFHNISYIRISSPILSCIMMQLRLGYHA